MPSATSRTPPPPGYLFIHDTDAGPGIASHLGITVSTYRKWRMAGNGPEAFKLGKFVAARESAVHEWIAEQERAAQAPKHEMRPPEPRVCKPQRAAA
jgi:predicted DNA-binding transcriptional regulator AlpA